MQGRGCDRQGRVVERRVHADYNGVHLADVTCSPGPDSRHTPGLQLLDDPGPPEDKGALARLQKERSSHRRAQDVVGVCRHPEALELGNVVGTLRIGVVRQKHDAGPCGAQGAHGFG